MLNLLWLLIGIAMLSVGGEALIRGALAAARRLKVSPLLVGLVVVGFGTSAPELAVSVDAALNGQPDIATGNVVGSNIGNVLLILGLCALIMPLMARPLALRRDAITVLAASSLFPVLAAGQGLSRLDGLILLSGLVAYLVWAYTTERSGGSPVAEMHAAEAQAVTPVKASTVRVAGAIVLGLVLLILGSRVLLAGAIGLATQAGLSEAVIGLTLVAVGTSLPELTISVMAAVRRQADVAVGNILGSNIFNLLGILGVSALMQPLPVSTRILAFDQWVMLGTALLVLLFLYTGRRLSWLEGAILLSGYLLYVIASFRIL